MRTIKTRRKVINGFGELVPAKAICPKSSGIFHRTKCGRWVKKVIAVREGLELTGESKRMETPGQWTKVPA